MCNNCCGAAERAPNYTPDRSEGFISRDVFTSSLVTVLMRTRAGVYFSRDRSIDREWNGGSASTKKTWHKTQNFTRHFVFASALRFLFIIFSHSAFSVWEAFDFLAGRALWCEFLFFFLFWSRLVQHALREKTRLRPCTQTRNLYQNDTKHKVYAKFTRSDARFLTQILCKFTLLT